MKINIGHRVSEKLDKLAEVLDNNKDILISSPTDSGKTYAIVEYAKLNEDQGIAFVMPTQALVENVKKQYERSSHIKCGYGEKFARDNSEATFICTTYDSYKFFEKGFRVVIIDEAHRLAGGGDFRNVPVSELLDIKLQWIMIHMQQVF